MGIIMKLLASPALRAIVSAVLQWLLSEAAGFVAKYLTRSVEIVKTVEASVDMPGVEKFKLAGDMLKTELKAQGVEFKDHLVDSAIQAAVGVMKAESEKLAANIKVP